MIAHVRRELSQGINNRKKRLTRGFSSGLGARTAAIGILLFTDPAVRAHRGWLVILACRWPGGRVRVIMYSKNSRWI